MIKLRPDQCTLDEFAGDMASFLKQAAETGEPLVVKVDGKAKFVVQDVAAYERMLDWIDRLETLDAIRQGQMDIKQGKTQPLEEAFEEIRQKYNIPHDA
jgi:PHD/YefM family antitoxin component YafN of YafNO toxin-antitoxin module